MKRKIVGLISLFILMCFTLTACGSKSTEEASTKGENDEKVIKLAHVVNENDGFHLAALKFKELVEKRTEGKVKIEIYPNAVLGDERTLVEGMQTGVVDMGIVTNGPIANFLPEIAVFEMPFLFSSPEEVYKTLDGEVGQEVLDKLETINIKGLAYAERGFRNLTNSKKPVTKPEDMKGLKIRVMENPVYIETFKALGANTSPMAWTEALTALQQGAIDGQENPINVVYSFKLYETQKYLTETMHTYSPATIMMNKNLFASFSEDTQKILAESAKEAAQYEREKNAEQMEEQLKALKENGMEIVDNPDIEAFREKVKPVYEKYGSQFGDLIDKINAAK